MPRNKLGIKLKTGPKPKYDKELHTQGIVEYGIRGKTIAQFCRDAGIAPSTYYNWKQNYDEFREAAEMYENNKEAYYDDFFQNISVSNEKFQNTGPAMIAAKAATEKYRTLEKTESQVAHIGNLTVNNISNLNYVDAMKKLEDNLKELGIKDINDIQDSELIEDQGNSSTS